MTDSGTPPAALQGNTCFVCGPDNPSGMKISFRIEDNVCRASYTVPPEQCGYAGVAHGGSLYSLRDDVMANWLYLQGERAVTGRCEVRYRAQTPVNTLLELEGRLIKRRGRHATMSGLILDAATGTVYAEATASFLVMPPASA